MDPAFQVTWVCGSCVWSAAMGCQAQVDL